MSTETIEKVVKEQVSNLNFVAEDVLKTPEDRRGRLALLERAVLLGNGYKGKVRIVFETVQGTKMVETTVWQAAEDTILLKGDVLIPIHSIREVIL